jgi:hypothetical protein
MPRGDRRGPQGCGPRTGRAMGDCANDVQVDSEPQRGSGMERGHGPGYGRGPGFGRGWGRGRRPMFGHHMGWGRGGRGRGWEREPTAEEKTALELAWLEGKTIRLQQRLDGMRGRMEELRGHGSEEQV